MRKLVVLPAPFGPEQPDHLAGVHRERHAVHDLPAAVELYQPFDFQQRHAAASVPVSAEWGDYPNWAGGRKRSDRAGGPGIERRRAEEASSKTEVRDTRLAACEREPVEPPPASRRAFAGSFARSSCPGAGQRLPVPSPARAGARGGTQRLPGPSGLHRKRPHRRAVARYHLPWRASATAGRRGLRAELFLMSARASRRPRAAGIVSHTRGKPQGFATGSAGAVR